MEILVVGDSHLTGRNPSARKDDLVEVQFNKWEKIVQIANKNDVPIVQTGDIFNIAIISNSLLTRFGEILSRLHNPLYFVWGNHDTQYHSLDLWDRTSLGVLWSNNNKVKHISEFWQDYKIWWAWYDWGADDIWWYSDKPEYFLSHTAVVNDKQTGTNSWILKDSEFCLPISELESSFKLILCGHWHKSYRFKYKTTRVINPGPITRRTIEEWFMPKVMLLNINTLLSKDIFLSDLDPEQVLSRTHKQVIETQTENVLKFLEELKHISKTGKKKSYMSKLFYNLDQHELPDRVEKIIREVIADLLEKGKLRYEI